MKSLRFPQLRVRNVPNVALVITRRFKGLHAATSRHANDREAGIILALALSFLAWALSILPMFAVDAYTAAAITAVWFGFSLAAALVAVGR
jgi:hypothetical protein